MPDNDDDKQKFMFTHLRPCLDLCFIIVHTGSFTSQTKE